MQGRARRMLPVIRKQLFEQTAFVLRGEMFVGKKGRFHAMFDGYDVGYDGFKEMLSPKVVHALEPVLGDQLVTVDRDLWMIL